MKRPELNNLDADQKKYLDYLEGCLNGSSELILALNTASRVFADDLNMICDGDSVEWVADGEIDTPKSRLTLLSADAKDKTFERIMVLFDKFDKIKALSQHFKGSTATQPEENKVKLKPGGNIYEHVLEDVKKNGRSRVRTL